ncbi:transposase [Roseomonas marmotae]|uniref:Transposase n=1 Tax=Roseomonas marmotae TaxID=2768161 RepID=A0ABS3KJR1_9PROT|nr:transposase [Roseomonas marmotae]QTI81235.1 transposase [Roseomonas marmotae]
MSRGGRTTKIHALSDELGRPLAFVLTPGQAADCRAAEVLVRSLPTSSLVMADRASDTNAVRQQIYHYLGILFAYDLMVCDASCWRRR